MTAERQIHEECGIFGMSSSKRQDVASFAYYGLHALQHRGQESAGIVVNDDGVLRISKGIGLIDDAIDQDELKSIGLGNISVGHVRYATTGSDNARNIQPIVINHHKGRLAIAHNGNLTNAFELRKKLEETGAIFYSTSDTEVIAYTIVRERLSCGSIEEAIKKAMEHIDGAYSLVISSPTKLIAVRDPHGFRPLCYGKTSDGSIVFASESCALDAVGANFVRDLEPGEIVIVEGESIRSDRTHCSKVRKSFCVFEYIYFARPDSVIDGASVSLARQQAGRFLAMKEHLDADMVIGVPDSGLEAAIGYSKESGIPYEIGFTKNKYIGRTFIAPEQSIRDQGVEIKLNPIRAIVEGKRIVLVDDSVVRGTTSKRIAAHLREAGAKEIHLRVSAPPFIAPCFYGTDIDSSAGLLAEGKTLDEMAEVIGVDSIRFLSMEDVVMLTGEDSGFCTGCFSGEYPTAIPEFGQKDRFETGLSQKG